MTEFVYNALLATVKMYIVVFCAYMGYMVITK